MKNKRISLSEYDATHLYELALENFKPKCGDCIYLKKRLEKFIGEKEVRSVKRQIKKYPYSIC